MRRVRDGRVFGALVLLGMASAACRSGESTPPPPSEITSSEREPTKSGSAPTERSPTNGIETTADPPLPPLDLPLLWSRLPLLPPGVKPLGWQEALVSWRTATTAYAAAEMEASSIAFLEVANRLKAEARGTAGRVRATARCLAYENAGRAHEAARAPERAIELLERVATEDSACRNSVEARIARLALTDTSSVYRRAGAP